MLNTLVSQDQFFAITSQNFKDEEDMGGRLTQPVGLFGGPSSFDDLDIEADDIDAEADAIDGRVRRIKREWPTSTVPKVIATGGLAATVAPLSEELEAVDTHHTLKGLQIAYSILTAD